MKIEKDADVIIIIFPTFLTPGQPMSELAAFLCNHSHLRPLKNTSVSLDIGQVAQIFVER